MSAPVKWWGSGLTEKQRRFVEGFGANGGNATAAAREAGYKVPNQEGARLLANAGIRSAIEELRLERTSRFIASREERQEFWTTMMRDQEQEAPARLRASELLGKCQGDFLDRPEPDVAVSADIKIRIEDCSVADVGQPGHDAD